MGDGKKVNILQTIILNSSMKQNKSIFNSNLGDEQPRERQKSITISHGFSLYKEKELGQKPQPA